MYLAKAGLLPLLAELPHERFTTPSVRREVADVGKEKAAKDALIIEEAIRKGELKIEEVADTGFLRVISAIPELHAADTEVLALAKEIDGIAVVDDRVAREVSRVYGIKHGGTAFILALLIASELITKGAAIAALDDMISLGWRCSVEQYLQIVKMTKSAV